MNAVHVSSHVANLPDALRDTRTASGAGLTEEMYRFIVENSHEGIWVTDAGDETIYVNRQMAEMLGYRGSELLGNGCAALIDPAFRTAFLHHQNRRRRGISEQFETCFRGRNGEPVWVLVAANPILQRRTFAGTLAMVINITDRKKAEMELRQSVERYNLAVLATRDGIWEWDIRGSRMYFSTRFCEIIGFTPSDTELKRTYQAWAGRIHPDHRALVEHKLQQHLRGGQPFEAEYQHLHRSGEYRWQKASGQALFDEYGVPFRMAGSIRDITHEKKVEDDIRREKEFSDALINSLPGVFYLLDESGQLERWNRNLEQVVGRSRAELAHMAPLDLVAPGDREQVLEVFEAALLKGWGGTELRLLRANGRTSDYYVHGKVIRNGDRPALLGMGIDISERKEAERLLRQSELKYHMLFDFNPIPLFVARASDQTFVDVNLAALRHYRYTRDEFLGMRYSDLELGASAPVPESYRCQTEGVTTHRRKDGQRLQVEVSQHHIDYNNEDAVLFLCLDVTDKLKNEELLRQSYEEIRELASHLQDVRETERTEIARDIHDELGQALTAVKMNLSSILRKPEDAEGNLAKIRESLMLTEQTMTSVRKIATELRPTLLDDLGLIEALRWYVDAFRRRTEIDVQLSTRCSSPIADPQVSIVIFRIVQESLTNVVRHAKARRVEMAVEQMGSALLLRIEDDGEGFDTATARKAESMGMVGMKERALSIKGEYTVVSGAGKGTMVQVFVPEAFKTNY